MNIGRNQERALAESTEKRRPHTTFYVLRFTFYVVLLALLAACGGSGITQTAQTEHYAVQLSLDGVGFGQREATIDLHDAAGNPVVADQVVLASVMHQMGMVAPDTPAQPIAPGRYRATGEFFSMIGEWDLAVRVDVGGAEEVATFKIPVTQSYSNEQNY